MKSTEYEMNITSWADFHNEFCIPNFKRNLGRKFEMRTQNKDGDLTTCIHKIRKYYNLLGAKTTTMKKYLSA